MNSHFPLNFHSLASVPICSNTELFISLIPNLSYSLNHSSAADGCPSALSPHLCDSVHVPPSVICFWASRALLSEGYLAEAFSFLYAMRTSFLPLLMKLKQISDNCSLVSRIFFYLMFEKRAKLSLENDANLCVCSKDDVR